MMRIFRNQKGITLVEVIVSVILVAIIVTSIIVTVAQSSVYSNRIDLIYTSSNLAKARMDELKLLQFSDLADRGSESAVRIDENGQPDASGDYLRTTEITGDYDGNAYLAKVKVSVDKYVDGQPSGSPVVIETLFADIE